MTLHRLQNWTTKKTVFYSVIWWEHGASTWLVDEHRKATGKWGCRMPLPNVPNVNACVCVCVDVDIMCCWFSKQRTNTNDAFTAMRTTTMVDEDGRRRQRQHTCTIGVWMAPAEQFPVCVCVYIALQMTHTKRISAYCCVVYIRVCVSLCHCVSGMDVDGAVKFAK